MASATNPAQATPVSCAAASTVAASTPSTPPPPRERVSLHNTNLPFYRRGRDLSGHRELPVRTYIVDVDRLACVLGFLP